MSLSTPNNGALRRAEFQQRERCAVIGGGILGMTLALRLTQKGCEVTLFEAAEQCGGLASAWQLGEVTWDRHYHVTLLSDTKLRGLLAELGLEQELTWATTRTGFYTDGKLYSMSNTLEFLRFPPLRLLDKLRLGATIFWASRVQDWQKLEKILVEDWLRKLSGKRTFEKIWLPLLRAKLGETYKKTSAAFIWATIARMYAARRTGLKQEMFGYVNGGYARVLERFAQKLAQAGVEIKTRHTAKNVAPVHDERLQVSFENNVAETFDRVIVTTPAPIASRICPALSSKEKTQLQGMQYLGIVCASALLKKPLADYYVTNITDAGLPFTAVIEMSALVERKQFNGQALIYLPKYVTPDDATFAKSDGEIEAEFLQGLERMYPNFKREEVLSFRVSRVRQVFALSTLNYSQQLPSMITSVPGLYIVNSAHIVNGTLNVNETVQLAEKAAEALATKTRHRDAVGVMSE